MTTRKQSWPEDLHEFLDARALMDFEWGVNDCCMFAADAALAITGTDPASEFREKYSNEDEAQGVIAEVTGGNTVADAIAYVARQCGWEELKTVLMAQRGDMVAVPVGDSVAAGIVHLNGREACFVSTGGLRRLPLRNCTRAWRVS